MSMMKNTMAARKFTGWHMIAVLALFFGTIISVNLTLAWYATHSWSGLVVKNSYVASQQFNDVTAEKLRQAELGWQAALTHDEQGITVQLSDKDRQIVADAIMTVTIGRPATEVEDKTLQMFETRPGTYEAETALAAGIWQADMNVIGPKGEVWTKSYRFLVKG